MRVGEERRLGHVDDVGQRGQAAAQPDRRSVDGRDHRDAAADHADHQITTVLDRLLPQRFVPAQFVEVVEVAARRERPPGAGDDGGSRGGILVECLPDPGQSHVQWVVDGVQLVRTVQRDDAQRTVGRDVDFVGHVVHLVPQSENSAGNDVLLNL